MNKIMKYKLVVKKGKIIEFLVKSGVFLMPFILLLNVLVFKEARIAGIGIANLYLDIVLIVAYIDSILNRKKYADCRYIHFFLTALLFVTVVKGLLSQNDIVGWLVAKQYYFWLPVVYIALSNKKLETQRIVRLLCLETIVICPLSIVMFLTTNYFGMAKYPDLLKYAIVGLPFARMFSIFGSPLVAGPFFAMISMCLVEQLQDGKTITRVLLCMNFICLILTFSRTALIAFAVFCFVKFASENTLTLFQKILAIVLLVLILAVAISIMIQNGAYFWKSDLFDNVRFTKWTANFQGIGEHWLLGYDFNINISSGRTWETTLSDNSFLIALADFGIVFWGIVAIIGGLRFFELSKYFRKKLRPILSVLFIFTFLYDFIQVFPCNYLAILLYLYFKNITGMVAKK